MPDHTTPDEPSVVKAEPASMSELARLIVAALVALGVFEFDDAVLNTITLIVGGLISIVLTWWTRRTVTPSVKPRTDDGRPLVPAATRPGDPRPGDDPARRPDGPGGPTTPPAP